MKAIHKVKRRVRQHARIVKRHARKVSRHVQRVLFVWSLIITLALSAILIPFFLRNQANNSFYLWATLPGVALYFLLSLIHPRLRKSGPVRKFIREYLETTATQLLLAIAAVGAAFVFFGFTMPVWGNTLLVTGAVLYAFFFQRVSFVRVIGL